ncbi:hmg-y-related protein a [Phtheirospermum japonicum]|uniref:Hmg-y-related protein a n=1 Tax=Phtheirospermum japonicum TaxID=374723 RepID=A0A830CBT5_9LAMI|nr:hmg-y-related protein a [Phtheirospermum japonicum]
MIMEAIEALDEANGSNKSSISKHIETTYGNLPPAHTTLLTHHLNRMRATGQLLFIKNNYLKPGPNSPPRRGRGRPPKPKALSRRALSCRRPVHVAGLPNRPPRGRGRPPKVKPAVAAPVGA